jgi:hypothetical protein
MQLEVRQAALRQIDTLKFPDTAEGRQASQITTSEDPDAAEDRRTTLRQIETSEISIAAEDTLLTGEPRSASLCKVSPAPAI